MPAWVTMAYQEYARRLPPEYPLHLIEIPLAKRTKSADTGRVVKAESERLLRAAPQGARLIVLDAAGVQCDSLGLARRLADWSHGGRAVALLVGGPDGLTAACKAQAELNWSLSLLTLPHALVRVVVAEQIYRAVCLLKNHPYHH